MKAYLSSPVPRGMADELKVVLNWQGSEIDAKAILLALPQDVDVSKGVEGEDVTLTIVVITDTLGGLRDRVDQILESVGMIEDH
jgi:hypothetical protein